MTTVVFGDNTGDDYSGTEETNLSENNPVTPQSGFEISKYGSGDWRHGLIRFTGMSALPPSITVSAANIYAFIVNTSGTGYVVSGYRSLRNWVEAQATWLIYSTGNLYATAGGTGATDRSSTLSGTSGVIPDTFFVYATVLADAAQLRTDVQNIASGTNPNYGWHLERTDAANDAHYRDFHAHDTGGDGERPYMTVIYTAGGGGAASAKLLSAICNQAGF